MIGIFSSLGETVPKIRLKEASTDAPAELGDERNAIVAHAIWTVRLSLQCAIAIVGASPIA
jgi:hypothetical protein